MKILYVIGSLEVGGAEQHLLRIASALAARGWRPFVFALTPGGPLTQALQAAGVPVLGVRLPQWLVRLVRHRRVLAWTGLLASMLALAWYYWRIRPQVTHFFLPAAYIVGGVTSLAAPRMLRIMSRRSLNHYQARHDLFRRVEHWLHPRMDLVCGNSAAVVRDLVGEGVPPQRLRLIYNGIDTARFRPVRDRVQVRAELGVGDDALMMVLVANLIAYKGHADLIAGLAKVQASLPAGWVCVCVGRDDGIGPELARQVRQAGLEEHFRFTGSRRDVPDLLAAADMGLLCSHEEGFSNAVIEGMASGLPMVVTDVGGNAEAVLHGQTGLVVPPRDPQALGQALLQLSLDAPGRQRMGQAGRARAMEHFSMDACVAAYEALYRQELPPAPPPPAPFPRSSSLALSQPSPLPSPADQARPSQAGEH